MLENKEPTKYASGGGMESYVREVWENEKNLTKGVNYLTECPICVPKYCYVGGIIDGFLYKSDGSPVIVEFKGKFENVRDSEPASGNLMNFDKRLL